jgi:plastocyanin
MPSFARRPVTVAVASAAVLGLGACGSSSSGSSSSSSTPATGAASAVKLSADPGGALKFDTTKLTAKAGKVTVEMANPSGSGVSHGIAVEGNGVDQDGKTVGPGGTSTDTLTLKPGTYTFYCPVPGHKAAGMKGTLVVT